MQPDVFDDVADAPPGGEAWWVPTTDGARVRVAAWPAAAGGPARGTVLLFPGRTEYVEKYGPAARHYTAIVRHSKGQDISAACGQLSGVVS